MSTLRPPPTDDSSVPSVRAERISSAMKAYLMQAKQAEVFMAEKREEFEDGKRHLANMMGWDKDKIVTQEDINVSIFAVMIQFELLTTCPQEAISYLLPSSLFDKRARPMMKPPEEVYPPRKAAQFDVAGRPFHTMFYTRKPRYFQALHDTESLMMSLNDHEDKMIRMGQLSPPPEERMDMTGSQFKDWKQLRLIFLENISEDEAKFLCTSLERLAAHPYSSRVKDFIMKYRDIQVAISSQLEVVPLKVGLDGRPYSEATGLRKHCEAHVKVIGNGTGMVTINGQDLQYFDFILHRYVIFHFYCLFYSDRNE